MEDRAEIAQGTHKGEGPEYHDGGETRRKLKGRMATIVGYDLRGRPTADPEAVVYKTREEAVAARGKSCNVGDRRLAGGAIDMRDQARRIEDKEDQT